MNILRVSPYPISTTWDVPEPFTDYVVKTVDTTDASTKSYTLTSSNASKIEFLIPMSELLFDRDFEFEIYSVGGDILVQDHLSIVKPYINPNTLATAASDIAEYTRYEFIARGIIDSVIRDGFHNAKQVIQAEGEGTDVFPIWYKINKVLKVYENNKLVYDSSLSTNEKTYSLTDDGNAVQRVITEEFNASASRPITLMPAVGDLAYVGYAGTSFPKGYDYTIVFDAGYKSVPSDIELCAGLLVDDLKCGKLEYFKRYVTDYKTDQFDMVFSDLVLEETGNAIVDKILDKYQRNIVRPGIL